MQGHVLPRAAGLCARAAARLGTGPHSRRRMGVGVSCFAAGLGAGDVRQTQSQSKAGAVPSLVMCAWERRGDAW